MHQLVAIALVLGVAGSTPLAKQWLQEGRIVGGEGIEIDAAPYQVSLVIEGRGHTCGGAILDKNIVVTAAHCVKGSSSNFQVRVGSSSVSDGGELVPVERLVWHEDFSMYDMDNDVAVLLLARELTWSERIAPIELLDHDIEDGEIAVVTGWGTKEEGGYRSEQLQLVLVPTVNQKVCSEAYKAFYDIKPSMLCAGIAAGGKDACQGDSGGPLSYSGKLAGIVSWGIGCARPGYPGVYTKVSKLNSWIRENVESLTGEVGSIEEPDTVGYTGRNKAYSVINEKREYGAGLHK